MVETRRIAQTDPRPTAVRSLLRDQRAHHRRGMRHEPPGRRWRPAAALALLVAVTATVGVVIAILQRPPTHAPSTTDADSDVHSHAHANPYRGPARSERNSVAGTCSGTSNFFVLSP